MTEWQPIDTAPKDGTEVVIFIPADETHKATKLIASYKNGIWESDGYDYWHPNPDTATRWLALPDFNEDEDEDDGPIGPYKISDRWKSAFDRAMDAYDPAKFKGVSDEMVPFSPAANSAAVQLQRLMEAGGKNPYLTEIRSLGELRTENPAWSNGKAPDFDSGD